MSHFPPEFLNEGKNSTAYYSKSDPQNLIVFVHGFSGAAVGTWSDFPSLIPKNNKFNDCDILYYGYRSTQGQAYNQGQDFFNFLGKHATKTSISLRLNTFSYRKIIIVAHSLGAVVSRYAMLRAILNNEPWRAKCRLMFFAPAHHGARIQNLVMLALPSFFKIAGGLGLFASPVIDDLKPKSTCLDNLEKGTLQYASTTEAPILKASVLEAYSDKIVHNGQFCYDIYLPSNPVRKIGHKKICKPMNNYYTIPIDELANFI